MQPSKLPGIERYKTLQRTFEKHLDMQFRDVQHLLTLPTVKDGPGCNFATAAVLTNILGGLSVLLFHAPCLPKATGTKQRGERFRRLLTDIFPRESAEPPPGEFAAVIYKHMRNELAHVLGLRRPGTEPEIDLLKWPLSEAEIAELERSTTRPHWCRLTVERIASDQYKVSVPALYWGTWRVLEVLLADPVYACRAEALLKSGQWKP